MNLSEISQEERNKRSKFLCTHFHNGFSHPNCYNKKNKLVNTERIGFLDIETTNFKADFAYILSYCIKEDGGRIYKQLVTKEDIISGVYDKRILKQFNKDVRKFDRVVGHYSTKFDIPFLRSRCLYWKLDFPIHKEIKHTDTYYIAKYKLRLRSNRLGVICDFLGIKAKTHPLKPSIWLKCLYGDPKALNYVLTHNIEDVVSLEKVWHRLIKYVGLSSTSV